MATQRLIPRYAHTSGPTSLAYTPDGKHLLTVGSNNVIRKFTVASEDEPLTIEQNTDCNTAITASNDTFITSSEDGTVSLFSMATATLRSLLVRCSLPTRDLALSPDGNWIAVASDETVVKVVYVGDNTKMLSLRGQAASNKHVSFHPSGNYLAVSGCDGAVYVYSLSSEEPELVKKVEGVIAALDGEKETTSEVRWCPDGRAFAAVTPTRDIVIISRSNWERQKIFASGHMGDITDFAWSPNGAFLASAGKDGRLVIWESKTQTIIAKYDYRNIVSLAWHPSENTISFTTNLGQLYTLPDAVPTEHADQLKRTIRPSPLLNDTGTTTTTTAAVRSKETTSDHPRRDTSSRDFLDDLLGLGGDDDSDFLIDDDGAGYAEPENNAANGKKRGSGHLEELEDRGSKRPAYTSWTPTIHEPFQPGSTPWRGNRRYLCLNLIGFAWTVDQDTHHTVTVEFYDREAYRDFHFTDPFLYDKACLNETGALFSSQPSSGNPAMLYYRPHETWATKSDWRTSLPEGEEILSIALSENYIVVCTSQNYVRVFTLFGIPFRVYRQKHSPVVSCASWRDYVLTLGNGPVAHDGKTLLTYSVDNVRRDEALQCGDVVALPEGGSICSVFFSDNGDPCIYDSDGVLLVLHHWRLRRQAKWVPLLDTRTLERLASGRKEESYWPVAVAQDKFHCIILKGGEKYPYFPRPLLSEFDFRIPLSSKPADSSTAAAGSSSDALEENFVRESVLLSLQEDFAEHTTMTHEERTKINERENNIDKTLLQLLVIECKEDHGAKALEICGLFRQTRTLVLAAKVAVKYDRTVLAQKIAELREKMEIDSNEFL